MIYLIDLIATSFQGAQNQTNNKQTAINSASLEDAPHASVHANGVGADRVVPHVHLLGLLVVVEEDHPTTISQSDVGHVDGGEHVLKGDAQEFDVGRRVAVAETVRDDHGRVCYCCR